MGSIAKERDAHLQGLVEPDETVLAIGPAGLVTDRRILLAWRLSSPSHVGEWAHDAIGFDEIPAWSEGRQHDERPILRVAHPPHMRMSGRRPHRFLWFRWGRRESPTPYGQTEFRFRGRQDPVYAAMRTHLLQTRAVQGDPFHEELPGTRDDRIGSSKQVLRTR